MSSDVSERYFPRRSAFDPIGQMEAKYLKIQIISPGACIFQRPFLRGLFLEGLIFGGVYLQREILRFKTDWVSLIVGSKFTVFALFYFVCEGNFPSTSTRGGLYLEGRFNGGCFALPVWGTYI